MGRRQRRHNLFSPPPHLGLDCHGEGRRQDSEVRGWGGPFFLESTEKLFPTRRFHRKGEILKLSGFGFPVQTKGRALGKGTAALA